MLKLDAEQYEEAMEVVSGTVRLFDAVETNGPDELARAIMEALAGDYDISAMEVPNDVAEGNVWPEESCQHCGNRTHTTLEHKDSVINRCFAELAEHNRSL